MFVIGEKTVSSADSRSGGITNKLNVKINPFLSYLSLKLLSLYTFSCYITFLQKLHLAPLWNHHKRAELWQINVPFYWILRTLVPRRHGPDFIITNHFFNYRVTKKKQSKSFIFSWREILSQKGLWTQTYRLLQRVSTTIYWSRKRKLEQIMKTLRTWVMTVWLCTLTHTVLI